MKGARITAVLIVIFSFPVFLYAQISTGIIKGNIIDEKTKQGLYGVNVIVKGTYYGAATDKNGYYEIRGVGKGVYDIHVSMIGYKEILKTGVRVVPGSIVELNFSLEQTTLALGQEIVVIGQRPIIDVDVTSSSMKLSRDEISTKIVEDVKEILAQQMGVTESDNEIHIRGGRVDEGQFIVDGISVKDPLTGNINSIFVNSNSIDELEFISGGFNAEYGQSMSGIVDVKLKEGSQKYEGSIRFRTDRAGLPGQSYFIDAMEFTLGGPEFFTSGLLPSIGIKAPGQITFFLSGYMNISNTYLPHASRPYPHYQWQNFFAKREENDWSLMGKLSWKIDPKRRLRFSYNRSLNINQGYFTRGGFPYAYKYILDNYPTYTRESIIFNIGWKHTLSSRTFYELNLGRFYTSEHRAVQNKHWTEYRETLDIEPLHYDRLNPDGDIRVSFGDNYWDH
ncbi:MAG: carboxypeptidase-like regulatory domain-containing protein, partial [Fidelibacterota bacterium]